MALVGINQMLRDARQQGYAVPGFCVWNAEMIRTTLQVAAQHNAPVILMSGPGEFPLLPPSVLGRIARAEAQPLQMVKALEAVAAVVRYWLELTGAAGQARS